MKDKNPTEVTDAYIFYDKYKSKKNVKEIASIFGKDAVQKQLIDVYAFYYKEYKDQVISELKKPSKGLMKFHQSKTRDWTDLALLSAVAISAFVVFPPGVYIASTLYLAPTGGMLFVKRKVEKEVKKRMVADAENGTLLRRYKTEVLEKMEAGMVREKGIYLVSQILEKFNKSAASALEQKPGPDITPPKHTP